MFLTFCILVDGRMLGTSTWADLYKTAWYDETKGWKPGTAEGLVSNTAGLEELKNSKILRNLLIFDSFEMMTGKNQSYIMAVNHTLVVKRTEIDLKGMVLNLKQAIVLQVDARSVATYSTDSFSKSYTQCLKVIHTVWFWMIFRIFN